MKLSIFLGQPLAFFGLPWAPLRPPVRSWPGFFELGIFGADADGFDKSIPPLLGDGLGPFSFPAERHIEIAPTH